MKVVVFTAQTRWSPHYETDLKIIQRHLDDSDEVVHLHCAGDLLACDDNPYHALVRCRACIGIGKAGLSLLSQRIMSIPFLHLSRANRDIPRGTPLDWKHLAS